jgi:recombination DNA repair RAD52 pathway protein
MLSSQAKLIEFILAAFLVVGCYFWIGHNAVENYKTEQVVEQAKADRAKQDKYDKLSENYEALQLSRKGNANTITRTYEKVIEKPVYSNVCIEPLGLQLANEAISGKRATELDAKVPSNPTP